jgi:hypothetical protein
MSRSPKITLSLALVAAAVVLLVPAAAQASTNVVPNPGFEQGGCGGNTPVVCGWTSTDPNTSVSQDTTSAHSGSASMNLQCASPACDLSTGGTASVSTDPGFCAPIGPGAHQASFWYANAQATQVAFGAAFYATPDCTGSSSSASLAASPAGGAGWQQVTGALAAPPGTQSALFSLQVIGGCIDACQDPPPCGCGIGANFDDVYVADVGDTSPPTISSFSPTSGPEDQMVTITGSNFTGTTGVAFNGTATQAFDVLSSTEIAAFVAPAATSGPISVTSPFGTGTSSGSFTVTPTPPVICCFQPISGPVGTSVDIMGTNFTGATSVRFNGTPDPSFVVNSATDITAHVPAGATTGTISVTTPAGTATGGTFTVTGSPPTITSFSPTSGPFGTSVDIQGSNFTGATSVTFNATAASYTVNSSTDITATVPAAATSGPVAVTTPSGTATSVGSFTITPPPPPTISSFTPASGPVGTSVSITGTAFTGATSVAFNGAAASYTVNSPTDITATVPSAATSGAISVTTPGGTGSSSTSFTVIPTPAISSFTPTSGPAGTSVDIQGTSFTGASSVTFNGAIASYTVNSPTDISAVVPAAATGTGPIAVTTPGGTATSSSSFTVIAPPTISGFSPTSGHAGQQVTITGANFTGTTSVKLGTAATTFTVNSPTQITATVPTIPHGAYKWSVTTPVGTATSTSSFHVT